MSFRSSRGSIHGAPKYVRSENGPEFVSRAVLRWLKPQPIETAHIDAGKPWQNGTDESESGRFRDECLSTDWFRNRAQASAIIETWRKHESEVRPHSSLGYLTPHELKRQSEKAKRTGSTHVGLAAFFNERVVRRIQAGHNCGGSSGSAQLVQGISNAKSVAAGFEHVCALFNDQLVNCWGRNGFGQVGAKRTSPEARSRRTSTTRTGARASKAARRRLGGDHSVQSRWPPRWSRRLCSRATSRRRAVVRTIEEEPTVRA